MQVVIRQAQAAQYPIYFLVVTRVIGAWQSIEFTTAAPEVDHHTIAAAGIGGAGCNDRAGRALGCSGRCLLRDLHISLCAPYLGGGFLEKGLLLTTTKEMGFDIY
jgi:hypothetical protein